VGTSSAHSVGLEGHSVGLGTGGASGGSFALAACKGAAGSVWAALSVGACALAACKGAAGSVWSALSVLSRFGGGTTLGTGCHGGLHPLSCATQQVI
jgi:hypothetical protein